LGQTVGFTLDPRRKEPLHRQIFDEVVARIEARAFPPGFRLPPSRELARELATHRNTVTRAYANLEAAGFVSSRVGRGTFVEAQSVADGGGPPATGAAPGSLSASPASSGVVRDLPWSSLLSRATRSEVLGRAERFARRADQRDVVNLARLQPSADLVPDDLLRRCVSRALAEHGASAMSYAPPEGTLRLREQIVIDLGLRGVPARVEELIVTSGSQQALDLVARALINAGDVMLVESTTYSGAIDLFRLAGARLIAVPDDGEGPDPSALERLARPDVKGLYLMPNAHNPTGRTLSSQRRRALISWSRSAGVPIIEDDYAAGLVLDERNAPPHLRALDGEVIHVSTFSKRLAPGLRVGYIVAPTALRPVLGSMKRIADLGASLVLQHALAEFLERGYMRAHGQRTRREYLARRDALDAALRKALPPSITWHRPTHGVVLWLQLPAALDPHELYEEALRRGVLVSPSSMSTVGSQPIAALRLAFCAEPAERLVEGARRLGKAMKHLLARTRAPEAEPRKDAVLEIV
jgi:2-aminoadipate transaminase